MEEFIDYYERLENAPIVQLINTTLLKKIIEKNVDNEPVIFAFKTIVPDDTEPVIGTKYEDREFRLFTVHKNKEKTFGQPVETLEDGILSIFDEIDTPEYAERTNRKTPYKIIIGKDTYFIKKLKTL